MFFSTAHGISALRKGLITLQDLANINKHYIAPLFCTPYGAIAYYNEIIQLKDLDTVSDPNSVKAFFESQYCLDALKSEIITLDDLNAVSEPEKIRCFFNEEIALEFLSEKLMTLEDVNEIKEASTITKCLVSQEHGRDILNAFKQMDEKNRKIFLKQSIGLIHLKNRQINMSDVVSNATSDTLFDYLNDDDKFSNTLIQTQTTTFK